jgi:putative two-component system response regulator
MGSDFMVQRKRILIVDDEPANRDLLEALLTGMGHETASAANGYEALAQLRLDFDLILLDVMMPNMDGFEVTRRIRGGTECPDIPICMVTTLSGMEERLRAVEAGANDFIAKPVDKTELKVRTESLLKAKEAQDALKHHQAELEETVARRTESLQQALQEMVEAQRRTQQAQLETIDRLALAAELKDEDTALHIKRMSQYCLLLARGLKLSPQECEMLLHASPMHDVGKIGIPDAILLKPGKLDAAEWQIMKTHTEIGARILGESTSELLQAGEIVARTHHEKWDSSGYPCGLSGEDIPLWGRIVAVADVFDALTSKRPYKEPFTTEKALQIMREGRATHFDPGVLDVFFENLDAVLAIKERYRDPETLEPSVQPPFAK